VNSGPDWPNNGEIDIIENVNSATTNAMTLHTSSGCSVNGNNTSFTGTLSTSNCDVNAADQGNNVGCGIQSYDTQSYGSGFNANGGGVYATEWTSSGISIWFFGPGVIPADISNNNSPSSNPNPAAWGKPTARFEGACAIDSHFRNMQIVRAVVSTLPKPSTFPQQLTINFDIT